MSFSTAKPQQLNTYVQEAMSNNPEIQAFELRYNIASEKVAEVNSLPDTQISAGYFISEPETRTGAQRAKLSVKQMLPWFGTITARENYTSSLAEAQYEDIAIARRKLALSVSQSYYKLYAIKAKQEVLEENIKLLNTYERLALTSVEVGKASAVDVLRLQIRKNELQEQREVLEQNYLAEQTLFNNLLNRDRSTIINVESNPMIPDNDVEFTTNDLQLHPELTKYDKLYASVENLELLNQKEEAPKIGFGLDYVAVSERADINPIDNGKDIVMPMVSVSIPLFSKKHSSRTKQNALRHQEISAQKESRLNSLENLLDRAIKNRTSARISYNTQAKNLKQAKDAEEILIKSYETGTIDFNDVLDIQELQLKFQINQIKSIRDYYMQSTIINYLSN